MRVACRYARNERALSNQQAGSSERSLSHAANPQCGNVLHSKNGMRPTEIKGFPHSTPGFAIRQPTGGMKTAAAQDEGHGGVKSTAENL